MMTTGTSRKRSSARIWASASRPSTLGMLRSSKIKPGRGDSWVSLKRPSLRRYAKSCVAFALDPPADVAEYGREYAVAAHDAIADRQIQRELGAVLAPADDLASHPDGPAVAGRAVGRHPSGVGGTVDIPASKA